MICKDDYITQLKEVGHLLHQKKYTPGYSGNISVRFGQNLLITTSGSANGFLSDENIVEIDFEGNSLEQDKKPSSEKLLHIEFYKKCSDVNCVLHLHCPALSAFAASNRDLMEPVMIENVCYFGGIPLAKYALPSSKELVDNTSKFFDRFKVVLMANHGVIVGGSDVNDAYLKLEMAEEYAKTIIYANVLAKPSPLSKKNVEELVELMNS